MPISRVHRRRGGEVLLRPLALVRPLVEPAEAEVAVGDEGAHAKLLGEGERVSVAGSGFVGFGRCTTRGNVTEQVENPRLLSGNAVVPGDGQGLEGDGIGFIQLPGKQVGLGERSFPNEDPSPGSPCLLHCAL
jgi:hypothetical protein